MEVDSEPKRRLERQIEEEMGDDYILDLQSKFPLRLELHCFIYVQKRVLLSTFSKVFVQNECFKE